MLLTSLYMYSIVKTGNETRKHFKHYTKPATIVFCAAVIPGRSAGHKENYSFKRNGKWQKRKD